MNVRLLKQLPMMLASLSVVATGHAGDKKDSRQQQPDCCSLCYAGPRLDCDTAWDISAAAIFERASVSGSQYAYKNTLNVEWPVSAVMQEPSTSFDWGFKVNLGYQFEHDDWHLAARYTYYKSNNTTNITTNYGTYVEPVDVNTYFFFRPAQGGNVMFTEAHSTMYVSLNNIDLILSRPTLTTSQLEVTPYYGLDTTWVTLKQTSSYTGGTYYNKTNGDYAQNIRNSKWWGIGPKVGLHTDWMLGYNFSLYGDAAGSLLYGNVTSTTTDSYQQTTTVPNSNIGTMRYVTHQFAPEVNFQLGVMWKKVLDDRSSQISFNIGYDTSYYFFVNRFLRTAASYSSLRDSGMGLQGLVLQAAWDF